MCSEDEVLSSNPCSVKFSVLSRLTKHAVCIFTGKALTVDSVDLLKEKNRELHHTDQYEQEELVLRRGQEFQFTLKFDRNVDKDTDLVFAKFSYGKESLV